MKVKIFSGVSFEIEEEVQSLLDSYPNIEIVFAVQSSVSASRTILTIFYKESYTRLGGAA